MPRGTPLSEEDKAMIVRTYMRGVSPKSIAYGLGYGKTVVNDVLRKAGVFTNTARPWTDADLERLELLVTVGGVTFDQIGKMMGRTGQAVTAKAHVLGLRMRGVTEDDRDDLTVKPLDDMQAAGGFPAWVEVYSHMKGVHRVMKIYRTPYYPMRENQEQFLARVMKAA